MNLVVNAADAMIGGGRLSLRTGELEPDQVWLSVQDTGVGIPAGIRDRVYEPFFTTKGAGKGTGLGLSVVHGIVTRHRGRIELDSAEGEGSIFTIILPRGRRAEVGGSLGAAVGAQLVEMGNGERVLVVEDEAPTRESLRKILVRLGYEVTAVGSAEEAGTLPADQPFDVLLTDLMLPGVAGPELAVGLENRWPDLRVVMMSGYTQDEAVRLGVFAGVVRFLQKPFDLATLAHEVHAALHDS